VVEVRTAAERVRGTIEAGLAVFRGIPFAAPPVNDLRFAAPTSPRPWDGVRDALAFGPPPPPQAGGFGMSRLVGGEDWLTLNVWSPDASREAGLPVMVWIYGGAYTSRRAGMGAGQRGRREHRRQDYGFAALDVK
jgi:para-nitrobenzyl esterase